MNKEDQERVKTIVSRACDMSPQKRKPDGLLGEPFSMYSFERAARIFWSGFISKLIEKGLTDAEIEILLVSRKMRWMFDAEQQVLKDCAGSMVTENMIEYAKVDE